MTPHHKTVRVTVGSTSLMIDELIAPLIKEMWNAFIMTSSCCESFWDCEKDREDDPKMAWIAFPNQYELKKLLDIVGNNVEADDMDSMYRRIVPPYNLHDRKDNWRIDVSLSEENICEGEGQCDFSFSYHLWFPQKDIEQMVGMLKWHNESPMGEG